MSSSNYAYTQSQSCFVVLNQIVDQEDNPKSRRKIFLSKLSSSRPISWLVPIALYHGLSMNIKYTLADSYNFILAKWTLRAFDIPYLSKKQSISSNQSQKHQGSNSIKQRNIYLDFTCNIIMLMLILKIISSFNIVISLMSTLVLLIISIGLMSINS